VIARYGGRSQAQEVTAQSSFYSASDRRLHFGLGSATFADLTVRWPGGATESVPKVHAEQLVVIREGAGILRRERFRSDVR
jgi:enediyne biosynthesis protein E4